MRRISLAQLFFASTLAIVVVVAVCGAFFLRASRASILAAAERMRVSAALRVEKRTIEELDRANRALAGFEAAVHSGALPVDDERRIEADLFERVVADEHLEEVTFTRATLRGYDAKGEANLAPEGKLQVSVFRSARGSVVTRVTRPEGDGPPPTFLATVRDRARGNAFAEIPLVPAGVATDPTQHPTFSVLSAKSRRGRSIWSDLHWAEHDQGLSVAEQRVVLTVQKAIEDAAGRFVGVVRVGLNTAELDAIVGMKVDEANPADPHRIALLVVDDPGKVHLLARVDPSDHMATIGDDLRVVSDHPPKELAALLPSPLLAQLDPAHPNGGGTLSIDGEPYLATLREIALGHGGTTGWLTAIVVPERYYTQDLVQSQRVFIGVFSVTVVLVFLIGGLTLGAIRRGLGKVVRTTSRMRGFDFAPDGATSPFAEVNDIMLGLERAKTVVRAMGKYIPVDLVRRLYERNEEPMLGGELQEVSLMFTDIEGFTTLSEKLPPDELARSLGDYLEVMTIAIESTSGTIDKYIGDAVMAMWNAPSPVQGHAKRACLAALACRKAAAELFASPKWNGLPPLVTRFGLHRANVMVGHFGAPSRLGYTALGDGVNLAARLEPLCKQYGVVILASEAIVAEAGDALVFRRIDRVAVKGKTRGIDVYELLGEKGDEVPAAARAYEDAFEGYLARDFDGAAKLLEPHAERDPASAVLLKRCRELGEHPPAEGWDGVHVAKSK